MGLRRTAMTPFIVSCALGLMLSSCVTGGMTDDERAQRTREHEQRLHEARMHAPAAALPPVQPIQAQPIHTIPRRCRVDAVVADQRSVVVVQLEPRHEERAVLPVPVTSA